MNFFNGFLFGKHGEKGGCGFDGGNDIWTLLIIVWLLSCCGINCDFDICDILPIIILLSVLSSCCGGPNTCNKGPY